MREKLVSERVRDYFRAMNRRLLAASSEAVSEHPGLVGGHRETICREYLARIIPSRYDIGRGLVYGTIHRSREADVVLWDASNYPRLQMADHTFFFAESVRAIIEIKSRWSDSEFNDIRSKAKAVRDIITVSQPNIEDDLAMLQLEIESIKMGVEHDGFLISKHHIGTGAIVLHGGKTVDGSLATKKLLQIADDEWPDLMLLVEAGKFVHKRYIADEDGVIRGLLEFYDLGEDALLRFTGALLDLLSDRVVHSEAPLYFEAYTIGVNEREPTSVLEFPLRRPPAARRPLWRNS